MGPGNGKVWKCCGINVGRYSDVRNYIPHPFNPRKFLYFIAYIPHLLKNFKESLLKNKFFILPEEYLLLNTNYHLIEKKLHISMN